MPVYAQGALSADHEGWKRRHEERRWAFASPAGPSIRDGGVTRPGAGDRGATGPTLTSEAQANDLLDP